MPAGVQGQKLGFIAADHKASDIDRMEGVNVLIRVDGVKNFFVVNMLGQRQLDQDTINFRVVIVFINQCQKICFRDVFGLIILDFVKPD